MARGNFVKLERKQKNRCFPETSHREQPKGPQILKSFFYINQKKIIIFQRKDSFSKNSVFLQFGTVPFDQECILEAEN